MEPELREYEGGFQKISFPLATDRSYKDKAGTLHKVTDWHRVAFFNNPNLQRVVERFVGRGSLVYVEGSLQSRKVTRQDGTQVVVSEVIIPPFNGNLSVLQQSLAQQAAQREGEEGVEGEEVGDVEATGAEPRV
jgi:single-strand DNA-binding protein